MSALCYCGAPATTGSLCTGDLARLQSNLRRTPDVLRDLDVTITGQAQQGGGGNGFGTPDVFNERASDARINLTYLLRTAARTADPSRRTTTPAEDAAVAVARVQVIARSPGAHTTAQDIHDALLEADRVRDRAEEKISYGPCSCGVQLVAPKSKDQARCRNPECGQVWDVHELRAFRHVAALDAAHDHRGKLAEVVKVLNLAGHSLKLNTVCKWVERGKLVPDDDGLFTGRNVAEVSQK